MIIDVIIDRIREMNKIKRFKLQKLIKEKLEEPKGGKDLDKRIRRNALMKLDKLKLNFLIQKW